MTKKEKAVEIMKRLDAHYDAQEVYLDYTAPYELLFATILSAQCTDERVNKVTKVLFSTYPTLEAYAKAPIKEIEKIIYSTGFYRNKAKSIKESAEVLLKDFDGQVPSSIEELTTLPGVGRKTANVVRNHVFNIQSMVVDTHVMRISKRLGLTINETPDKIEKDLMKVVPENLWQAYNIQIIAHGRAICKAQSPKCDSCFLSDLCPYYVNEFLKK